MLMQFTVQNFLSFDGEATLSMLASPAVEATKHPRHLIGGDHGTPALVRAAALYGANAAGKSNLIKAIGWARKLILDGTRAGRSLPVTPFKLRPEAAKEPSRFGFVVRHKGVMYEYGFAVDRQRVREEWLFATPDSGSEERVFQRVTHEDGTVEVEFGTYLTGESAEQAQFWQFLAKGTRPEQLLLTEARERNQDDSFPILDWIKNHIHIVGPDSQNEVLEGFLRERPDVASYVGNFLFRAGTGITQVTTVANPFNIDSINWSGGDQSVTRDDAMNLASDESIVLHGFRGERKILQRSSDGEFAEIQLWLNHASEGGKSVALEMNEQSDGTQRLIHLLPILNVLQEQKGIVFVDEIDRRLHPKLSEMLVQAALACPEGQTPPQSQLIFTTHETHLLDLDLLRPDEIWFAEKDRGGASHLYSLAEFDLREGLQLEKGYLNGRFGAIPFVGDASLLCEPLASADTAAKV